MALKIKVSKADYDALDDSLKTLYVADGENYKLDADYEDVTGLKAKRDELLREIAEQKKAMKAFEGLDPEAAKAAIAAAQKAEDDKLTAAGDIDAIKKQYEERIVALEAKHAAEKEAIVGESTATLNTLKRERLANVLTEKGVLPDRARYLVHEMDADTELVRGDDGFEIRKKGGIGDAAEFDAMIEGVKAKSPFFFAADNAAGSGASGSDGKAVGHVPKIATRQQLDSMTPEAKREFYLAGGEQAD